MLVDVSPLIDLGFVIFPVMQGAKMPPLVKRWQTQASRETRQVEHWFSRRCNVAVATGAVSDIFVLDIDPKSGGASSLAKLFAEHGLLPETLTVRTPSGGQHRYFRWPGADIRNSRSSVGAGLDIRGWHGYVLAPPSYVVDPETGEVREYIWLNWGQPIADAPDWLLTLMRERRPEPISDAPLAIPQPTRALREGARDRRYGEAILANACRDIASAPNGRQEETLNGRAFTVGKVVGGGYLGAGRAVAELVAAGMQMHNYGVAWTHHEVSRKVLDAVTKGMNYPWEERGR